MSKALVCILKIYTNTLRRVKYSKTNLIHLNFRLYLLCWYFVQRAHWQHHFSVLVSVDMDIIMVIMDITTITIHTTIITDIMGMDMDTTGMAMDITITIGEV